MLRIRTPARRSLVALAVAVACAGATARADDAVRLRGRALLAPFKQALQRALESGLTKGPIAAVDACRVQAPEIAREQSRDGVRVGRASHRLRNPANVAPEWVEPILERYLADPARRSPQTATLSDGRQGYVEPITLAPLCVTCHGDALNPALAERIASLYPEDRAVGFRPGDLRGVFWIEMPAEAD